LEGAWAGKTGVSEPKTGLDHEWGCRARLDLSAFLKYTRAVYRTVSEARLDLSAFLKYTRAVYRTVSELVARVRWLT